MKSVGGVMAIRRAFRESLGKATRSLGAGRAGFDLPHPNDPAEMARKIASPGAERMFEVAHALRLRVSLEIEDAGTRIAVELGVVGLMNMQIAVTREDIYNTEVSPRASRTVPFVSKATRVPLAKIAAKLMMGKTLAELCIESVSPPHMRYDRLVESLGEPSVPAVGFTIGVNRAVLTMAGDPENFVPRPALFLASRGDAGKAKTVALAHELRSIGHDVEVGHRKGSLKSECRRADELCTMRVTTIGDDELASRIIRVRDMSTRNETEVTLEGLSDHLTSAS